MKGIQQTAIDKKRLFVSTITARALALQFWNSKLRGKMCWAHQDSNRDRKSSTRMLNKTWLVSDSW